MSVSSPSSVAVPVPRLGDTVTITNLRAEQARKYNGSTGTIEQFLHDTGRYKVGLAEQGKTLAVKPCNLLCEYENDGALLGSSKIRLHLLIPCHVASERRFLTFMRCATSVARQVDKDVTVFVSISGTDDYRDRTQSIVRLVASKCDRKMRWLLRDSETDAVPQFEHIRAMIPLSEAMDRSAWMIFVDNDDMFHPLRVTVFKNLITKSQQERSGEPICVPCKLLLSEDMGPDDGRLDRLIENEYDFDKWKSDEHLSGMVTLAKNESCIKLDAEEYFDYAIPTAVARKSFDLTPREMTSHRFCDLRFQAILDHLTTVSLQDNDSFPWLIAHYKVTMDWKLRTFDNHGLSDENGHVSDQSSFEFEPDESDVVLAFRYSHLSPGQVAMCRSHVESGVIQYYGWNGDKLREYEKAKVAELNKLHGTGFGETLWSQSCDRFQSMFSSKLLDDNSCAW